jgi:hypothetical protein
MARDDGALVPHNVSRMFAVKSSRDPPQTKRGSRRSPNRCRYPGVDFIVANMASPVENVVATF